jgi:medium-chain acyl-[acyl-carrier-protein] hydrolase
VQYGNEPYCTPLSDSLYLCAKFIRMTESDLTLISKFKVSSADTDMSARARLGAVINYLVQAAIDSADKLGFGFEHLSKENLFWVLSSLTVEIDRPLNWYEELEVETWPKDVHRVFYIRDFLIRDSKGITIGRGTSGWLAIDFESHRPHKYEGKIAEIFHLLRKKSAMDELPEKLKPMGDAPFADILSTYFDIDLNRHVTSTRYIDRMMDLIPLEFHMKNYPKTVSINYLKETSPGDTLRIKYLQEENTFYFEGFNLNLDLVSFRGKIGF